MDLSSLRALRQKAGMSQKKLADKVGVTQAHIAKIELGKVDPRFSTVSKIFNYLDGNKKNTCEKYMISKVICVNFNESVHKAAGRMKEHGLSQLPVCKGKEIVGLLTERNILLNNERELNGVKVKDIMEGMPPRVSKNTSIESVKSLLLEFPAVVVMDEKRVAGIITKSDLIR